jgi:hypothetical protein
MTPTTLVYRYFNNELCREEIHSSIEWLLINCIENTALNGHSVVKSDVGIAGWEHSQPSDDRSIRVKELRKTTTYLPAYPVLCRPGNNSGTWSSTTDL